MARRPSTGFQWPSEDLLQKTFTNGQKTFYNSPIPRRPSTDLLLPKDLLQIFNNQKTFHKYSMAGRLYTGLPWPKELLQVFYDQKTFYSP